MLGATHTTLPIVVQPDKHPVIRGDHAAAALTMTFAQKKPMVASLQASLDLLIDAGKQISLELPAFDTRL